MRIAVASDVHLEFAHKPSLRAAADVLVLAGDITVAVWEPSLERLIEALEKDCQNYDEIIYVMGNHEHYRGDFDKSASLLADALPSRVKLLDKHALDIKGVQFVGGTLWTDMNGGDPTAMLLANEFMNDYRVIDNFSVDIGMNEHRRTLDYFNAVLRPGAVVVTHHAPHFNSVPEFYRKGTHAALNPAYYTDLSDFMERHQPALWIHGHMHEPADYVVHNTRVVAHPHGYPGERNYASQYGWRPNVVEV